MLAVSERQDLVAFERSLRAAWDRETSADPAGWSTANPSWGQCAITALAVQDEFGGLLLRGVVDGISHYWNMLPDGTEIDFTRDQFDGHVEPTGAEERARDYVLSFPATARRYELLRDRLANGAH